MLTLPGHRLFYKMSFKVIQIGKVIFLSYHSNATGFIIIFFSIERETLIFPKCDKICPVFLEKLFDHLPSGFSLQTLLEICSKLKYLANRSNHDSFWHHLMPLFIFQTQITCVGKNKKWPQTVSKGGMVRTSC